MAEGTGFNWTEALKLIIPAGVAAGGAILSNRAANKQNEALEGRTAEMDALAREEMQRRQMYSNLVLPSLLQAIGRKDPNLLKSVAGSGGMPPGVSPHPPSSGGAAPAPSAGFTVPGQSWGVGSGLKTGAGAGASIGSMFGPVGTGIGAAVGAAGGAIAGGVKKFGADESNNWVNKVQNPLNQQVGQIVDPIAAARQAGTLTTEQLEMARRALEEKIAQYNNAAGQYAGQGSKQKRVIDQSYNTLNPIFKSWRDSLMQGVT
jgi:hypothetical protein